MSDHNTPGSATTTLRVQSSWAAAAGTVVTNARTVAATRMRTTFQRACHSYASRSRVSIWSVEKRVRRSTSAWSA